MVLDLQEAIDRIEDRLTKGEHIKANIHNIQSKEDIQIFWQTHTSNLDQLVQETTQFEKQSKISISRLLRQFKEGKTVHDKEVGACESDFNDLEGRAYSGAFRGTGFAGAGRPLRRGFTQGVARLMAWPAV